MRELTDIQRRFVRHYIAEVAVKPHGAQTRAARAAGYKNNKYLNRTAHDLLHDPARSERVIAAINEECRKLLRVGQPEAVAALYGVIRDPTHRDHMRAVALVLDRTDPLVTKHTIDVTHRNEDPDREGLEQLKALRKVGATREKLLELHGPNGLDRLEALEAVELAQRSTAAKVIEHRGADNGQ
jgi:phage terminase small subunit